MQPSIISRNVSYTFADYFKLNLDAEDILAHFGYSFQDLNLYRVPADLEPLLKILVYILIAGS